MGSNTYSMRWGFSRVLLWLLGAAVCISFSAAYVLRAYGQDQPPSILIDGADAKSERPLAQPTVLLESLGITKAEAQRELAARPRIIIAGAGSTRTAYMTPFTNAKPPQRSIEVSGAGGARQMEMLVPTAEVSMTVQITTVNISGAGSVRNLIFAEPASP